MNDFPPATPGQEAELERLQAKFGDGSPEAQELAEQAHKLRERVFAAVAATRTALWEAAPALHDFHEARAWEPLGYTKLEDFLDEPQLEVGHRQFLRIIGTYRTLVIERGVSPATLAGLDLSKIEPTLPAIKTGKVSIEQAFSDAHTLRRDDIRKKYSAGSDPNAPIDPGNKPTRHVPCEACDGRGWITLDGGEAKA